jgi:hypothetical protein
MYVTYDAGATFAAVPENVAPEKGQDGAWTHYQRGAQDAAAGAAQLFPWWSPNAGFRFRKTPRRVCVVKNGTVVLAEISGPAPPAAPDPVLTIEITSPSDGSIVVVETPVVVSIVSDRGVVSVAYSVDGIVKFTDTSPPYEWIFSPFVYPPGLHEIRVDVVDAGACTAFDVVGVFVAAPPP